MKKGYLFDKIWKKLIDFKAKWTKSWKEPVYLDLHIGIHEKFIKSKSNYFNFWLIAFKGNKKNWGLYFVILILKYIKNKKIFQI